MAGRRAGHPRATRPASGATGEPALPGGLHLPAHFPAGLFPFAGRVAFLSAGLAVASRVAASPLAPGVEIAATVGAAVPLALLWTAGEHQLRVRWPAVFEGNRSRRRRALTTFAQSVSAVLSLDELARSLTDLCRETSRVEYAGLLLPGASGDFSMRSVSGRAPDGADRWRIERTSALFDAMAKAKKPQRVEQLLESVKGRRTAAEEAQQLKDLSKATLVPLISRGQIIGLLAVGASRANGRIGREDLATMATVAMQGATAIENARLYGGLRDAFVDLERTQRQLIALQQASVSAQSTLELDQVLAKIAAGIIQALDYEHAFIHLKEKESGRLRAMAEAGDGGWRETVVAAFGATPSDLLSLWSEHGPLSTVLERDGVYLYQSLIELSPLQTPAGSAAAREHDDPRTIVFLPLRSQDATVGSITLISRRREIPDSERGLLQSFAAQAAATIANAQLYDDLQTAYVDLQNAQDRLVRTERLRVVGEMASGVAHDFNNVLAGILARAQLATRQAKDEQMAEHIRVIEQAAQDGAQIIRRIQDLARVRTDKSFAPVDVNEIVRQVVEFTRPIWKDAKEHEGIYITVETDLQAEALVSGNAAELREGLTNIFINALDAMPDGGTLTIATSSAEDVRIAVRDTGTGMTEETKARLLDPFFTTKGERGNGLGMSLVLGIVHRHQGRVDVESELGAGTTVIFVLPIMAEVQVVATERPEEVEEEKQPVLLIDDDDRSRTAMYLVLLELGFDVTAVGSPREGLQLFGERQFPVVITDLGMHEMSGWDVASTIHKRAPETHIVMVTGWAAQLDPERIAAHGITQVLSKPFTTTEVRKALKRPAATPTAV
jgi:signal transduction histidine kinase/CheY-like chemotaxis protein